MDTKLSVVCWRWGTLYSVEYVNRLRSMLARHLHIPHDLFCVTDDPTGMDGSIEYIPMFPDTFPGMASPSGRRANFRRLRTFDADLASVWGPRILMLDIDVVLTDDVTSLCSRTEPLIAFDQRHNTARPKFNTSIVLMDTGILGHMWTEFKANPADVWDQTRRSRVGDGNNSDQAVFNYYLTKREPPASFGRDDGVVPFYMVKNQDGGLLPNTRVVLFFGSDKQDDPAIQKQCPWIQEHWK